MSERKIKCVVWDLDNTLWDGVLLEDGEVTLNEACAQAVRVLDERGILHSIASRNDPEAAMAQLKRFGMDEYFLHPQIGWEAKSESIAAIRQALNIGIDTFAFVDDQPFEREEVAFRHPEVLCLDAVEAAELPGRPEFTPSTVTPDARARREMYRSGIQRDQAEREFGGTPKEFLSSLDMTFTIFEAEEDDLPRAEELTVRTNQLNSTGITYSLDEIREYAGAPDRLLLMAELDDKYGSYGRIGLALVDCGQETWTLKLLLMSCRVISRGVGTILLHHIMRLARDNGVRLRAEFRETPRNRAMFVTYRLAGFTRVAEGADDVAVLESDLGRIPPAPDHLRLRIGQRA